MSKFPRVPPALEVLGARFLFALPPSVQQMLAGGEPNRIDGVTLSPELQLMMSAQKSLHGTTSLRDDDIARARARMLRDCTAFNGATVQVGSVQELELARDRFPLRARHYVPAHGRPGTPLLVFLHGGGFVLGDLDTHDAACRLLCRDAEVQVLAIDYRLAPEHPFPAAVEDACFALEWAQDHAVRLGADPHRIAIGGDSAGGTLSAVAAQLALTQGRRPPCFQLLIYPGTDRVHPRPSWQLFETGYYLTREDALWFNQLYLAGRNELLNDPRFSPLLTPNLAGLCPALVVIAGFDILRDEGEAYVEALRGADVAVEAWREPTLLHGFINMIGISRGSRDAVSKIARHLREALAVTSDTQRARPVHGSELQGLERFS